jgi:hypothetical protein
MLGKNHPGLGLENRNEINGANVRLILAPFRRRQFAFVALNSKFIDARLRGRIGAEAHQPPCHGGGETIAKGIQQTIQNMVFDRSGESFHCSTTIFLVQNVYDAFSSQLSQELPYGHYLSRANPNQVQT